MQEFSIKPQNAETMLSLRWLEDFFVVLLDGSQNFTPDFYGMCFKSFAKGANDFGGSINGT